MELVPDLFYILPFIISKKNFEFWDKFSNSQLLHQYNLEI